jgi:DNA-binding transcriptional MerR regulator
MKLDDIIALAKQGYKPGDIKELLGMAEENKTAEPETLPEEPAQQAAATPEGQPPVDTVEQAQTDNTAVLEDKIKELEGKLQQAQQANLDASTAPKKEETAADILADYLQKF